MLGVSPETVLRDWRLAKVWLQRELNRRDRARDLDRWRLLERIFHETVERPVAERRAFLDSACARRDPSARSSNRCLRTNGLSLLDGVRARCRGSRPRSKSVRHHGSDERSVATRLSRRLAPVAWATSIARATIARAGGRAQIAVREV